MAGKINVADLSPSPCLSYVIGVVLGDGYLRKGIGTNRAHLVVLTVKDKEFTEEFARCLGKLIRRELKIEKRNMKGERYYYVRAGSKNLFYFIFSNRV